METATHGGSRSNLLGDKPQSEDIQFFSNEKHVNANTPPAILLLSDDDKSVPTTNSVLYYESLKKSINKEQRQESFADKVRRYSWKR